MVRHPDDDGTVLIVTWEPLTIVEARGFISYSVEATPSTSSRKRQQNKLMKIVPGNASIATLTEANPSTSYTVVVIPITSSGVRGQGEFTTL